MPAPGAQHQSVINPFEERVPRISEYTAEEIANLQQLLERKLGPEYISARPGPSGSPVHYIGAEKVISLANDVFSFNGWSSSIQNIQVDYADENAQTNRITLGISVVVRVTLRDGTYHEDIGYGKIENAKGKGAAFEKAKKEATTDAMKRALRHFGNVLGNCIYDKEYVKKVTRVKFGPGRTWDVSDLHRHPDFKDDAREQVIPKPAVPAPTTMQTAGTVVDVPVPTAALAAAPAPAAEQAAEAAEAKKGTDRMPDMTDGVTDAFFDDEYGGAFDPSDFAPDEEGHPDEVSISTSVSEKPAPPQAQPRPPISNTTRPNQPLPNHAARNPQTPIQNQSYHRPPPQGNPPPYNKPNNANIYSRPTTNTAGRTTPIPRMNGPANGAPTHNVPNGAPAAAVAAAARAGFYSARAVSINLNANDVDITNPGQTFDPMAESPSIRKTVGIDHTSSKPIARNGIHVPPSSQDQSAGTSNPARPPAANVPTANTFNAHARRIGAPGASPSPLANRGQYKPPSMKRPLEGPGGAPDNAARTALAEVSTNGPGGAQGAEGGGATGTKRQKVG